MDKEFTHMIPGQTLVSEHWTGLCQCCSSHLPVQPTRGVVSPSYKKKETAHEIQPVGDKWWNWRAGGSKGQSGDRWSLAEGWLGQDNMTSGG